MRAVKAFLNLFLIALCAIFIFGAVTDNKNARIMEQAVKGGYEALLAYEGRDNSDTFNTPEDYVAENGGKIDNVEDWGKRKLAFEIDKLTEGDYTLVDFHADPAQIAELDRVLRINDAVKRHMIVRRPDKD